MGTSRNDPSPDIPVWHPTMSLLGRRNIPANRQTQEIWRSISADDSGERFASSLSSPMLAEACRIVDQQSSIQDGIRRFDESIAAQYETGLTLDMGRRALARTLANGGHSQEFVAELFTEAVSYYASRDLPSVVGCSGRIGTATELVQLKQAIRQTTRDTVLKAGVPIYDHDGWGKYILGVVELLKGVNAAS